MELMKKVDRWDCVADCFSMESIKNRVYGKALPTIVDENKVVINYCLINELNLYKAPVNFSFTKNYSLTAERDGNIVALFTYFDAIFSKCHEEITSSMSPSTPATHRGQI